MTDSRPARTAAPAGSWPSPFSAAAVAAGKVSRSGLQVDGRWAYWLESRPDEGGRQVLVRASTTEGPIDVSPPGRSIRSRVHEYGGGSATVEGGTVFYVDQEDQALYRWEVAPHPDLADTVLADTALADTALADTALANRALANRAPVSAAPTVLTAAATGDRSVRYADGRLSADGGWFICVEERHGPDGVTHGIVAVDAQGSLITVHLLDGRDFYAAPRPSPDGADLAWLSWDHPQMPWDGCELWVGRWLDDDAGPRVAEPRCIAGGTNVSIGQPVWCRDGSLVYMSDESGWWQPYRVDMVGGEGGQGAPPFLLVDDRAEFHGPDWILGQSTLTELPDRALACRRHVDGFDQLVRIPPPSGSPVGQLDVVSQPCVAISGVSATAGGEVIVLGATASVGPSVYAVGPGSDQDAPTASEQARPLSAAPTLSVAPGDVAVAEPVEAPSPHGPVHSLLYAPASSGFESPPGSVPPLVVMCHGGPTAAADPGFDPLVQYFTSRGLAVLAVNYRGSAGYGRAYRQRLRGLWGVADIDDCVAAAVSLAEAGSVDGDRMVIRGTSAGGLTALGALVRSDRFAGAAAWYGVTDLEALAAETHDFESRYVDTLVGPLPEALATYRERSPIHHADRVTGSVLLLQGLDDPVVPADQAERFAATLRAHGVNSRYQAFAGESHGFRRAETLRAAVTAELGFYADILGFEPSADRVDTDEGG
jgi:dipeptidyl aminopeptidase/acylaminoacyl peptidase